jgi:2-oxoglutarate dehydrogenase E2 component (dihydrolipoamide succinyltransferase)
VEVRAPAEQTEGTRSQVLRWLKGVGEPVAQNEPLLEIETDKVTVEVASPGTGVLREIVKGEQEEITPGDLLGRIEVKAAADAALADAAESHEEALRGVGARAREHADKSAAEADGTAVSSDPRGQVSASAIPADRGGGGAICPGASDAAVHTDPAGPVEFGRGASEAGAAANREADSAGAGQVARQAASAATRLSPAVRRLLSEHALDPSGLRGTGMGGRITVEDVLAAVAVGIGVSGLARGTTSRLSAASDVAGGSHRVPHTPLRKRIAEHMVQSLLHTAPHVTTVFDVDMTAVLAHRQKYREEFSRRGAPLTLTVYFLQAIVDAIGVVPEANSRWTDSALEVFDSIHIGVGTALEDAGLVVPVLRDVQSRDLFATAEGLNDLVTRAREGRLTPADVRGGTFTISNHGVSGSLLATPIVINQPQAAILGVGKLEKRAVVVEEAGEDKVIIQPRCYVTLTIDHRVMDGHQANRFMQRFVTRLTNWP